MVLLIIADMEVERCRFGFAAWRGWGSQLYQSLPIIAQYLHFTPSAIPEGVPRKRKSAGPD